MEKNNGLTDEEVEIIKKTRDNYNKKFEMTIYETVKNKLEKFPDFRERSRRAKYLSILTLRDLGLEQQSNERILTLEELADFALKFASFDRAWRDVLEDNPSLQGKDYNEKTKLEQEKQIELGYEVGYSQDIKQGKLIK